MSVYIVWIDREEAKLFQFSHEKMERSHLKNSHVEHHTHRFDQNDYRRLEKKFYAQIADKLLNVESILVVGPGVAKHHFQNYLIEQVPSKAKRVIGCETVDHPSDDQIAHLAKVFFSVA